MIVSGEIGSRVGERQRLAQRESAAVGGLVREDAAVECRRRRPAAWSTRKSARRLQLERAEVDFAAGDAIEAARVGRDRTSGYRVAVIVVVDAGGAAARSPVFVRGLPPEIDARSVGTGPPLSASRPKHVGDGLSRTWANMSVSSRSALLHETVESTARSPMMLPPSAKGRPHDQLRRGIRGIAGDDALINVACRHAGRCRRRSPASLPASVVLISVTSPKTLPMPPSRIGRCCRYGRC